MIDALIERPLALCDGIHPALGGLVLGAMLGALSMLAFSLLLPHRRFDRCKDGVIAAVYDMRLSLDYPGQLLRAAAGLWRNLGLAMLLLVPSLLVMVPATMLVWPHLSRRFEARPLRLGDEVLVHVRGAELQFGTGVQPIGPLASDGMDRWQRVVVRDTSDATVRVSLAERTAIVDLPLNATAARSYCADFRCDAPLAFGSLDFGLQPRRDNPWILFSIAMLGGAAAIGRRRGNA